MGTRAWADIMEPWPAAITAMPATVTIMQRLDIPERQLELILERGMKRVHISVSSRSSVCRLQRTIAESHAELGLPELVDWINLELVLVSIKPSAEPRRFWGRFGLVYEYGGWLGNFPDVQGATVRVQEAA